MEESFQNVPIVVVATGIMNAGGTETLIMETLRHASGRIKYILLIHYDNEITTGVYDEEIKRLGIEIRYIRSVGSLGVRGYIKAFKLFAQSIDKIDIVHSHLNGVGGIISMAAHMAGIKRRICHCHADIHYTGGLLSRTKNELSLALQKGLIDIYATDRWACSQIAWERLFMPWHKRVIIHNIIDTRKYLTSKEKRKAAKSKFGLDRILVIGAVGRVAPIKNYETILKALVGTDAHFVCFGRFDLQNAYCANLAKLAKKLEVEEQVHWMGNSNNVANDIHCIDLFVMPSFTEGFGMAAIEAQAASIPSLLSSGVPQVVDTGLKLVKVLNPNDTVQWNREIKRAHNNTPIISEQRILNRFGELQFDSQSAVTAIENNYLKIIENET